VEKKVRTIVHPSVRLTGKGAAPSLHRSARHCDDDNPGQRGVGQVIKKDVKKVKVTRMMKTVMIEARPVFAPAS